MQRRVSGIELALAVGGAVMVANVAVTIVNPWGGTPRWSVEMLRAVRFASSLAVPAGVLCALDEQPRVVRVVGAFVAALFASSLLEVVAQHGTKDLETLVVSDVLHTAISHFFTGSSWALVYGTFAGLALLVPWRERWFAGLALEGPLVAGWALRRVLAQPDLGWDGWKSYVVFYATALVSVSVSLPVIVMAIQELRSRLMDGEHEDEHENEHG